MLERENCLSLQIPNERLRVHFSEIRSALSNRWRWVARVSEEIDFFQYWFRIFTIVWLLKIGIHIVQYSILITCYIQIEIFVWIVLWIEKEFYIADIAVTEATRILRSLTFSIRLEGENNEARFLQLVRCFDSPHMFRCSW